jgi:hypothetical protein
MNHEMNIQEANNIKNLYKGVSTSKKQDIALKANKSKKKKKKKKKWLYSSRNSTSSSRKENLTREKGKRSQV